MGSSARDPGKLFTNGKEIVEESVKRSQFALSVATGERFGLSPKSKNSFPAVNPFHSLEYMGIPRRVVIDPAMNHDLRVAETEIPIASARPNSALGLYNMIRSSEGQANPGVLTRYTAKMESFYPPQSMKQIEREVCDSVHKAKGEYPVKFVCPEVTSPKSQPDRFSRKPVIELQTVGAEEVPMELTDAVGLVSSGDTLLINNP